VVVAAGQAGLETALIESLLTTVVAIGCAAIGLAFALGSRGSFHNLIAGHFFRRLARPGDRVRVGEVEGTVMRYFGVSVVLRTKDGEVAFAPLAIGAALTLAAMAVTDTALLAVPAAGATVGAALLVETIFTFALALMVLNVATDTAVSGNSFYGIAIGFTVVVAAFAGGSISGGAFNPAVGLGPALVAFSSKSIGHVWIYAAGPLLGGALASVVYGRQHPAEDA
jgi:glycerol uptake facilitator-like aquaporin